MLVVRCLVSKRLRAIFPHSIKRGFKFQEIKLSKKSSDGPESNFLVISAHKRLEGTIAHSRIGPMILASPWQS